MGDLEAFVTFPTPKILSVQSPDEVARLYPLIQQIFPSVAFTVSKPYFLEAEPPQVSKGAALRRLAEKLCLSPERTLVFGDSLNDLPMLNYAVHSVAMGNARNEVKSAARHICGTNAEDGVARFIETHARLAEAGIGIGEFYPVPLHLQKAFRSLGYQSGSLPNAERACRQSICLPVFPELSQEEAEYIIHTIRSHYGMA